jgi:hypothetical protein
MNNLFRIRVRDINTDDVTFEYVTAGSLPEAAEKAKALPPHLAVVGYTLMTPEVLR